MLKDKAIGIMISGLLLIPRHECFMIIRVFLPMKLMDARNPRTGEAIQIPASNQPKFRVGKALKQAVN